MADKTKKSTKLANVDPRTLDQYLKAEEILGKYVDVMKVDASLIQIWDDVAAAGEETPIVYMMFNSVLVLVQRETDDQGNTIIVPYIAPNLNGNPAMLCYESAVLGRECGARTTDVIAIDPVDGVIYQGEEDAWTNHQGMIRRMALNLVHEMGENIAEQKKERTETEQEVPELKL